MRRVIAFAFLAALGAAVHAQSGTDLFQKALSKERVEGQLTEALALYERIVKEFAADRALVAKALVQMGRCYEALGRADARRAYERVLQEFADQKTSVAEARARLAALRGAPSPPAGIVTRQLWASGPRLGGGVRLSNVSPDGRRILLYEPLTGLTAYEIADPRKNRVVISASLKEGPGRLWAVFAPNGADVAYAWFNGTRYDLRVLKIDGTAAASPRVVYEHEDVDWIGPFDWSPDGQWIAVQIQRQDRTAQIALVSVSGSLRVLKSVGWQGSTNLAFSPDGRLLAFDLPGEGGTGQRDIFLLTTDGSQQIPAVVGASNDRVVGWAPDGTALLFISDRAGSGALWAVPLRQGQSPGPPALVKPDFGDSQLLGLTRSGTLMFRTTGRPALSIAAVDFDTGKVLASSPVQSIPGAGVPAWSPDGKHLAYVSNIGKTDSLGPARGSEFVTVAIRAIDTGQTRELHPHLSYFSEQLRWSPDGRRLMGHGADENGREGFYLVDVDTGRADIILSGTSDERVLYPQWLPDGKRIVYVRGERTQNFRIRGDRIVVERDLASGTERELMRDATMSLAGVSVSPDGSQLAYTTYDPTTNLSALVRMRVRDNERRELLRQPNPPLIRNVNEWLPDGSGIVYTTWDERDRVLTSWVVHRDGGPPRRLALAPSADDAHVHADGRRVVFRTPAQGPSQLWVLENLTSATPSTTKRAPR